MAAKRVPVAKHPGFYEQGDAIVFPYRDRLGRQHWGRGRTLTEAKRAKKAIETDVARGEHRPQAKVGFTTYARQCMASYQGRTSKAIDPITRADYLARLEQDAIPFFKETPLGAIDPSAIKAFCAHVQTRRPACRKCRGDAKKRVDCKACKGTGEREGTVAANTVRLALAPLKVVLATAFEDGVLRVNPAAGVRVLKPRPQTAAEVDEDEMPVKAMSEAEAAALLGAVAGKPTWAQWSLFFRLLLDLGLRVGEIIELRWRDVELGDGAVRIRRGFYRGRVGPPKTRFGRRTLPLTPSTCQLLWALRKQTRAGDGDLVFTSPRGGRVDASNLMERVLKPAARAAGVGDWIGFHTFRHTCATLLFKRGLNAKQVQVWLGHHSAAFTLQTYVHLLSSDLPDAIELVPTPKLREGLEPIDGPFDIALAERLFKHRRVDEETGCWVWTGARNEQQYGRIAIDVHRVSFEVFHRADPGELIVAHSCDNPSCFNPEHLWAGTQQENVDDAIAKDRIARGEGKADAKLNEADVVEIRRLHAAGEASMRELARRFGVSHTTVVKTIAGARWSHVDEGGGNTGVTADHANTRTPALPVAAGSP
jgi:integrase